MNNENKFYLIYKHLIFHLIRKYKELISYTKFEFHSFNSWDINEPQNHIQTKSQKLQNKYIILIQFLKNMLIGFDFYVE